MPILLKLDQGVVLGFELNRLAKTFTNQNQDWKQGYPNYGDDMPLDDFQNLFGRCFNLGYTNSYVLYNPKKFDITVIQQMIRDLYRPQNRISKITAFSRVPSLPGKQLTFNFV